MKELYFVRHGQTEWNAIRRMQGQWNSDLTELGRDQADINGKFLSSLEIDYLVASPLDRTKQTADIINQHLELEINYDDRIMEWHSGDWSGEMWDDVSNKWPEEFAAWQEDQFNYRGPDCENFPDMIKRTSPFLDEIFALDSQPNRRRFTRHDWSCHGQHSARTQPRRNVPLRATERHYLSLNRTGRRFRHSAFHRRCRPPRWAASAQLLMCKTTLTSLWQAPPADGYGPMTSPISALSLHSPKVSV